jgi:mannosyl-oligosaccharide alpha-1,2-mannosidase
MLNYLNQILLFIILNFTVLWYLFYHFPEDKFFHDFVNEELIFPDKTSDNRQMIRRMMKHAWDNYEKYAWGMDELKPMEKSGINWGKDIGYAATIIDSLDTLYIMGFIEEFKRGRDYVVANVTFEIREPLSVFETTIRVVGGLISASELSGDVDLLKKAVVIADKLLVAFSTSSGIPVSMTSFSSPVLLQQGSLVFIAECGSLQMEFLKLSRLTGNPVYEQKALDIIDKISSFPKDIVGLYPTVINVDTKTFFNDGIYRLGERVDSFYEYLLKVWILDRSKETFRGLYDESVNAIINNLVRITDEGFVYIGAGDASSVEPEMEHLTCFAGGMFALGAASKKDYNWEQIFALGVNLTETCYHMYTTTKLGLAAEKTNIYSWKPSRYFYLLRPEVIESIFILWRLTHNQKYREWGLNIANQIEKHCKTKFGYVGIQNITKEPLEYNNYQQTYFLAETLKYLFLLFSDDNVISLDNYVFNTEAHPFKVYK